MKIPFVVIVQAHLLRDKESVRLRCVTSDGAIDNSVSTTNEQIVSIENLASTIKELSAEMIASTIKELSAEMIAASDDTSLGAATLRPLPREPPSMGHPGQSSKGTVDCIYVDHDQYYDPDRPVSKAENWKVVLKTMKSVAQRGEQFISGMLDASAVDANMPLSIFAVADISFWALREFGTCLMKRSRSERSATGACREVTEEYPRFKRVIKTLGSAIESFMKRNGYWIASGHQRAVSTAHHQETNQNRAKVVTILLYSRADDRFDMVSLEIVGAQEDHTRNARRK